MLGLSCTLKGNETNHQLEQVIKKILDDSIILLQSVICTRIHYCGSMYPPNNRSVLTRIIKKTTKKRNNYKTAKKSTETTTNAKVDQNPLLSNTHMMSEFGMNTASQHQFKRGILRYSRTHTHTHTSNLLIKYN